MVMRCLWFNDHRTTIVRIKKIEPRLSGFKTINRNLGRLLTSEVASLFYALPISVNPCLPAGRGVICENWRQRLEVEHPFI